MFAKNHRPSSETAIVSEFVATQPPLITAAYDSSGTG